MNYTELTAAIESTIETTFPADVLELFVTQAEQKIYSTVELPAMTVNASLALTTGNRFLSLPARLLYVYSMAVVNDSSYEFLLNKDPAFIREAYPNPATTGTPKHYAFYDVDTFVFGPTPDDNYVVELQYGAYPESIVTAGTTWLGTEFDSALLNGALVEAIRFIKGEEDMVKLYQQMYLQSLELLKNLGEGKMQRDAYRSGYPRVPVK